MTTERWGIAQIDVTGTGAAAVIFEQGNRSRYVEPFTSGDRQLVRFSPDREGRWEYRIQDAAGQVVDRDGLDCTAPGEHNHGPVEVTDTTRFRYADGTPFVPIGTRALWWHQQDQQARAATIRQLQQAPFTKIRMSVTREGSAARPGPAEFDQLEDGVRSLAVLGIQVELVVFSADLLAAADLDWDSYLRDVVARFAAFRSVSWCLAVDSDLWDATRRPDEQFWDEALRVLAEVDHGQRLRTVQAGAGFDFGRRLISHCSLREEQPRVCSTMTARYRKPVVIDDLGSEGDADDRSGSRRPEDLVSDLWEATCRGGAAAHSEWYDNRWWAVGGELKGAAAPRLAFLRSLLESAPPGLHYGSAAYDASTLEVPGEYYLQYLGAHRFRHRRFELPEDGVYRVEVIDTWELTVDVVDEAASGDYLLQLPPRLYNAVRITRC